MSDEKLYKLMGDEWQKIRRDFYFPQLPKPKLVDKMSNGGRFSFKNLEITLEEPYVKSFRESKIENTEEESDALVINECLTHELTHFMKYPGSVLNVLRLQKAGQKITDAHTVSRLKNEFIEAQTNLDLIMEQKHPGTVKISKILNKRGFYPGDLGEIHYGLYEEISGYDIGTKLTKEEKKLIKDLSKINFLDKKHEILNFRKFVKLLKDYNPPKKDRKMHSIDSTIDIFSDNQIREGLKQFAEECFSPSEYEEVVNVVMGNDLKNRNGINIASDFYTSLAENYSIPIRKKPMIKNGGTYPHSHENFSIGDLITDVDAFSTPGILPGITKKWARKNGEVYGDEEGVPDSFIIIDSSGSMPNPTDEVSIPVLGATVISNAYSDNGAKVSVYNFSSEGEKILYGPSKNKKEIHKTLRTYFGSSTVFDTSVLKEMIEKYDKPFDISVISDMDISNLKSFIDSVLEVPQTHRIHLLYSENDEYVDTLRENFGNRENVALLPLIQKSDIDKITMGELKKSVR